MKRFVAISSVILLMFVFSCGNSQSDANKEQATTDSEAVDTVQDDSVIVSDMEKTAKEIKDEASKEKKGHDNPSGCCTPDNKQE